MVGIRRISFILVLVLLWNIDLYGWTFELRGELSAWTLLNLDEMSKSQLGVRYIPFFSIEQSLAGEWLFESELAFKVYGYGQFEGWDEFETDGDIGFYRVWGRITGPQFETRIGLQKLNFGSATIFRPLMWFDRIDPRDPLQLTDGVYALLFRYYFINNTNFWIWGLYGNDETKGWELLPSNEEKIEYGGRLQFPLYTGELAFTYHHRDAVISEELFGLTPASGGTIPEHRFGIDGKWDMVIGLWFEGVLMRKETEIPDFRYQQMLNLGMDYTFDMGNGIYLLGEHFVYETSDEPIGGGNGYQFSALMCNYPIDILHSLTGILYYNWENEDWYRYINLQRVQGKWSFYFIGFWNPDRLQLYQTSEEPNLFAGKGLQIMAVFNH